MCMECYIDENRITPLLKPLDCLANHTQYICGTCGRCICIEHDPKRGLQRWNFPFKSLEIAKLYLRTADYSMKKPCGIYELKSENDRFGSVDCAIHRKNIFHPPLTNTKSARPLPVPKEFMADPQKVGIGFFE